MAFYFGSELLRFEESFSRAVRSAANAEVICAANVLIENITVAFLQFLVLSGDMHSAEDFGKE